MKKGLILVSVFCLLGMLLPQEAPLRGKALYDAWRNLNLVKSEGSGRVTWLPGGKGYLEKENDEATGGTIFYAVNPQTQKKSRLFSARTEKNLIEACNRVTGNKAAGLPFSEFSYIDNEKGIEFQLPGHGRFVYWFSSKRLLKLETPAPWNPDIDEAYERSRRRFPGAAFSPDYSRYAFIRDYDIHVYDLDSKKEETLTSGGSEMLMNGCTDWVYPEELDQTEAFWWSPDSTKIAFLQFDEREVYIHPLVHDLMGNRSARYEVLLESERYPKAGGTNPTVKLFLADIATKRIVEVDTKSSGDTYLTRVVWRRDSREVLFQRLNRFQNRLELLAADAGSGNVRTVLVEEEPCFVNLHDDFFLMSDNRRFVWSSERTGWKHLYLYSLDGKLERPLTQGEWEAGGITCVDERGGWVYFTIYDHFGLDMLFGRSSLKSGRVQRLERESGTHYVSMDPAGNYYIDNFSSLAIPPRATLHRADGTRVRTLRRSDVSKVRETGLEEPELIWLKAADGQTDIYGILFKPAGFDPAKKYPLYITVYGGPSHRNSNSYQTAGYKAQLAQLGYLVWEVDGRGTTRRGKEFLTQTYLKFGEVDVDDQAAAVKQLRERPYIDGARVGMTGGSYGGYMTCMSLLRYPDVYSAGVASAPVTDWRNYDSIYTERYMRTPEANAEGYKMGSAFTYAKNLKGKLLLIHGSVDNNVHPANTLQLAEMLQKEGKDFEMMFYPGHRHGIRGYSGQHAGNLSQAFFLKHLQPEGWTEALAEVWK